MVVFASRLRTSARKPKNVTPQERIQDLKNGTSGKRDLLKREGSGGKKENPPKKEGNSFRSRNSRYSNHYHVNLYTSHNAYRTILYHLSTLHINISGAYRHTMIQ